MAGRAATGGGRGEGDFLDVISTLVCVECGRASVAGERGWQGHLVDGDDESGDEVVFFCPCCAEREFGRQRR